MANYLKEACKKVYRNIDEKVLYNISRQANNERLLYKYYVKGVERFLKFDYNMIKMQTLNYVQSMKTGKHVAEYKYSASCTCPNIYSSTYACMIRSLYRDLEGLNECEIKQWVDYFHSFQCKEDGLFRDPSIYNEFFDNYEWWGSKHLALHVIISYEALKSKPLYDFYFLEPYYSNSFIKNWLETREWTSKPDDVGNEIMNIGVLLQYSRDNFNNKAAGIAVNSMINWLTENIKETGLWSQVDLGDARELSKAVQGAYHIYPIFTYDGICVPHGEKIVDILLLTQNDLGGFGVKLNSSACEDIDSIEPLIRFASKESNRANKITNCLTKAMPWILANMNDDGGFVFKRNERFVYCHKEMSSNKNESSMFATWFRTLCLSYLVKHIKIENDFQINRCPGMEISI